MIKINDEGIVLEATERSWEKKAVLNPACIEKDGIVHMFYRAVDETGKSSIGYCTVEGTKVLNRSLQPVMYPEFDYESQGIEDPRIIELEGIFYMFYTAYDGKSARVAYATTDKLPFGWVKKGLISAPISYVEAREFFKKQKLDGRYMYFEGFYEIVKGRDVFLWQKDAFLFPRRINGKIAVMHRILPGMQIAYVDNLSDLNEEFWREYLQDITKYIVMDPKFPFESRNIGGGCPPIETKDGWLLIYHAVDEAGGMHVYHAAAALVDKKKPTKIIARLPYPLFSPILEYEKQGEVNNVVFPTGAVLKENKLWIYYGAADKLVAAKSVDLQVLLSELKYGRG